MFDPDKLRILDGKFKQGLEKLRLLRRCLTELQKKNGYELPMENIDENAGELAFWFAGGKYYIRIRITDKDVDQQQPEYKVPIGWLDWGRFNANGNREAPESTNYFDDRGILCELEKEEFYCNFKDCTDERVVQGLTQKLDKLVSKALSINNIAG